MENLKQKSLENAIQNHAKSVFSQIEPMGFAEMLLVDADCIADNAANEYCNLQVIESQKESPPYIPHPRVLQDTFLRMKKNYSAILRGI